MSAYIVDKPHIDTLVAGLALCELLDTDLHVAGAHLWRTNMDGVQARYPTDDPDELPGPVPFTDPATYRYQDPDLLPALRARGARALLQLLKAIRCYEYRSDTDPALYGSWAWTRLDELQAMLYAMLGVDNMEAIDTHPVYKRLYDACDWGIQA